MRHDDLYRKMKLSSIRLEANLSRQFVSGYFPDLGAVSNSTNRQELIDLWSQMWPRNRVRVVRHDDLYRKMKLSSIQLEANLSRQFVLGYFPDLGAVSNSTNRQELIDLWSQMWPRNRVRVVRHDDLYRKMKLSSIQLEANLSRQFVLGYFPDLGAVSNSTNRQELSECGRGIESGWCDMMTYTGK